MKKFNLIFFILCIHMKSWELFKINSFPEYLLKVNQFFRRIYHIYKCIWVIIFLELIYRFDALLIVKKYAIDISISVKYKHCRQILNSNRSLNILYCQIFSNCGIDFLPFKHCKWCVWILNAFGYIDLLKCYTTLFAILRNT